MHAYAQQSFVSLVGSKLALSKKKKKKQSQWMVFDYSYFFIVGYFLTPPPSTLLFSRCHASLSHNASFVFSENYYFYFGSVDGSVLA